MSKIHINTILRLHLRMVQSECQAAKKANKNNGQREEGTLFTAAESVNWPSHCRVNTEVSQTNYD